MKSAILSIFLLLSIVSFSQQTFYDVDYGDNQDHWKTWAKIVVTRSTEQLIIDHYPEVGSKFPIRHTYRIISRPSYEQPDFIVKLNPYKYISYRVLMDEYTLSFHQVGTGGNVFHYYSAKGIGNTLY